MIKRRYINSRADFFRVLDEAIEMTHEMLGRGAWTPIESIGKQLEAIQRWTEGGRTPAPEERRMIDIGRIVDRELEPAADAEDEEYQQRLYEIDGYFTEWLSDRELVAFDDTDPNYVPLG